MNVWLVHFYYTSIFDQEDNYGIKFKIVHLCHFNHIIVTIETGEIILYICLSRDLKVINVFM